RFLPIGVLDTSFGTAGVTTTDISSSSEYFSDVAITPSGAIVAAGTWEDPSTGSSGIATIGNFVVARYIP
ncbi:MAG TPA: hypothetical protein VNT60_06985, partial [Deinococcales bacterium]|nr:hypothetical protein [Deinococcales bacterium]